MKIKMKKNKMMKNKTTFIKIFNMKMIKMMKMIRIKKKIMMMVMMKKKKMIVLWGSYQIVTNLMIYINDKIINKLIKVISKFI